MEVAQLKVDMSYLCWKTNVTIHCIIEAMQVRISHDLSRSNDQEVTTVFSERNYEIRDKVIGQRFICLSHLSNMESSSRPVPIAPLS